MRTELQLRFSDKWGRGEDGVTVVVLQLVGEGRGRSYSCGSPSSGGGMRTELQLRFSDKWER